MAMSNAAAALKGAGKDVIDLGLGEPDFVTPRHIIEAAYRAGLDGKTRYTPKNGSAEIKEAVVEKFRRNNALDFDASQITVSNGAKQVIFNALMGTLEPGDEVLLVAPYFGSYPDITRVVGGVPKAMLCHAKQGFRLQPDALEAAITPRTRWLVLNSPNNPSGAVYGDPL